MTAGSGSDEGFTTDPGIRLLTKIGDFVEPLTRFDRGHLTLESSQHVNVDVIARQVSAWCSKRRAATRMADCPRA